MVSQNKNSTKEEIFYWLTISNFLYIIVLLILAGVTIATLTGDNGILTRATEAKNKTEEAQEKEALELAITSNKMEDVNALEIDKEKLENAIKEQFGNNKDFSVTDNEDGTFLVNMNDTKRMYYIDENGEIIVQSKILKISTADELKVFRDDVNSGNTYEGWYVYLTNDITLDINEEWQPIGIYLNSNTSIDDETNLTFEGIFDGRKHTIDGMKITSKEKGKGLFGLIKNATIKNLIIEENCNINIGVSYGSIVGYANIGSTLENCINKATITLNSTNVGGIIGSIASNCVIKNCYNTGNLEANLNTGVAVGGIVGTIAPGQTSLENCYNTGNINANSNVGGIAGLISSGQTSLKNCYNIGNIKAETTNAGGIVGIADASIVINCYNTGNITGTSSNIGGIVGLQRENSKVKNTYSIGNITGNTGGGIVGVQLSGEIENSYYIENTINGSSGYILEGATAISSEELKNIYTVLGEAFKQDINNINNGYPILTWQ